MKTVKHLDSAKDWSHPEFDKREHYLSDIFMLAGVASSLIFLVSVTI